MTHDTSAVVVVGSGMAAWTLIREFRKLDRQTPVFLVTRDSGDFYSKPMLSNALGDAAEVEGQVLPYVLPLMAAARTLAAHLAGQPATLRYPAMPVAVKTPALPLVVSPPAAGASGQWQITSEPEGMDARFVGDDGSLLGFALAGSATTRKATLQKLLPALIA